MSLIYGLDLDIPIAAGKNENQRRLESKHAQHAMLHGPASAVSFMFDRVLQKTLSNADVWTRVDCE